MSFPVETPAVIPPLVEQLEEMKVIKKPRKPREQKHDFKDGFGRVPAKRHVNGKGWVAHTAVVEDSVYVGRNCEVYQNAYVTGKVRLIGNAKISGHATVSGNVFLSHNTHIFGRAVVNSNVKLENNSRIMGAAHVTGESRLRDTATVTDNATVVSSYINNDAVISGTALLINSQIHGKTRIAGNAVVIKSTTSGRIMILNFAQVLHDSSLTNHHSEFDLVVQGHAVVADHCNLHYPMNISGHAVIVRCRVCGYDGTQGPPSIGGNTVISDRRFNDATDIMATITRLQSPEYRRYVDSYREGVVVNSPGQPFAIRQATQPLQANYLVAEQRPRRVQRLQEAGT